MQGRCFGLQAEVWLGHNRCVRFDGTKKYHDLCYVDEEQFAFSKITNKGPT